jgi:hypothetical protein
MQKIIVPIILITIIKFLLADEAMNGRVKFNVPDTWKVCDTTFTMDSYFKLFCIGKPLCKEADFKPISSIRCEPVDSNLGTELSDKIVQDLGYPGFFLIDEAKDGNFSKVYFWTSNVEDTLLIGLHRFIISNGIAVEFRIDIILPKCENITRDKILTIESVATIEREEKKGITVSGELLLPFISWFNEISKSLSVDGKKGINVKFAIVNIPKENDAKFHNYNK